MATLYDLTERYRNILEIAEMLDEEQLNEALAGLDDEIENKADGYAKVIQELQGKSDILKKEEMRLAGRRKTIENNIKRMKESLQDQMLLTGKRKFKTELFSFNIQNNPQKLVVEDEKEIPKAYWIEQPPKLDRRLLLNDLKLEDYPDFKGARVVQERSLRIR